jgi:hypothetical protein
MTVATINASNNIKTMTSTCSTTTMMNIKNKTTKKIDNTISTTQVTSKGLKTLVAKKPKTFSSLTNKEKNKSTTRTKSKNVQQKKMQIEWKSTYLWRRKKHNKIQVVN